MIEILEHAELAERCHGDLLCLWAAQGLVAHSRAWRSGNGSAVAVAGPDLSTRNRIAVHGQAEAAAPLVRGVLNVVGRTFRPLGDPDLIAAVVAGVPELTPVAAFGWMDSRGPVPERPVPERQVPNPDAGAGPPSWLTEAELPEISALMNVSFPDSDAQPGGAGVERWAGVRDEDGRLMAVTALAWSAPDVGYLAGVAVHPDARGRGHGAAVCRFVLAQALASYGAAALMVEEWNEPAIRMYRRLGMSYRTLTAAAVT
jgi:GNAT superfamily N-acetyltransferase